MKTEVKFICWLDRLVNIFMIPEKRSTVHAAGKCEGFLHINVLLIKKMPHIQ